ncbi:MAG: hypothetical protein JNK64_35320 [Myxococcales bacterium]|nr:hypothetical protein [Myxococcales bacterium]
MSGASRLLLLLGWLAGVAAPARAGDLDGGSLVAIGSGPAPSITGDLGARLHASGGGCRIRMGGWFGRLGAELVLSCAGVDTADGHHDSLLLTGPSVAWLPVATRWFQLGARGGLMAGTISGDRTATVPCDRDEDCASKQVDERVSVHGFAVTVGLTAQLTLGARRGGRFVLWADVGTQLARFQFADAVVAGRLTQLTIGIGHAHAF